MYNTSLLWDKGEYVYGTDTQGYFFVSNGRNLVFPKADLSERVYVLEALDIVTGQSQWQTIIPGPISLRAYDNKFFVLSGDWLVQAPAKDNQELAYCSFRERHHSLSAYNINTGEEIWSYGYRGANSNAIHFINQSVYLEGSHDHGNHELLIDIDVNSGLILHQRCNGPNTAPPRNSGGNSGSAFFIDSVDKPDYYCSQDNRFCFATERNRLHVFAGSSKQAIAYIDFEGVALEPAYMDVVVHNNILVVHLDDSDQLFAFRLP